LNISRVWSELIAVVKAKSGCFRRPRFVASALLALGCCLPLTPVFAADRAAISLPAGSLSVALRHLAESTGSEIVSVDPAVAAVRVPALRVGSDPARVGATAQGNRLSRGQDRCAWFPDRTGAACARASARGACQFLPGHGIAATDRGGGRQVSHTDHALSGKRGADARRRKLPTGRPVLAGQHGACATYPADHGFRGRAQQDLHPWHCRQQLQQLDAAHDEHLLRRRAVGLW
jgi:hypothetical protein